VQDWKNVARDGKSLVFLKGGEIESTGCQRRKERGGERKNMSCKIVQGRKKEGTKNGPV